MPYLRGMVALIDHSFGILDTGKYILNYFYFKQFWGMLIGEVDPQW